MAIFVYVSAGDCVGDAPAEGAACPCRSPGGARCVCQWSGVRGAVGPPQVAPGLANFLRLRGAS